MVDVFVFEIAQPLFQTRLGVHTEPETIFPAAVERGPRGPEVRGGDGPRQGRPAEALRPRRLRLPGAVPEVKWWLYIKHH